MKKSLLIFSVVLLIAGLFISCNSEAAGSEEDLVYVTFADEGKALSSSITTWEQPSAPNPNNLKWYYKASKASGAQVGAKSSWTPVKDGNGLTGSQIGPFSVGNWKFEVIGCDPNTAPTSTTELSGAGWTTETTVKYAGVSGSTSYTEATNVKLVRGTTTTIPVAVKQFNAETASPIVNLIWNVSYPVTGADSMYYKVSINGGETTYNNSGTASKILSMNSLQYSLNGCSEFTPVTVKFEVYDAANDSDPELKVAENSVTFPGLKGSTVTISGTLDDLGYAYGEFGGPTVLDGDVTTNEAYLYHNGTYTPKATLATAIADADNGDTVGLLMDVNLNSTLQITKSITLDGNSRTINSSVGNTGIAILFYYGGAYYSKENTYYDNPEASALENMELATPVVNNLSVNAPGAKYGIVFEGFVNATISNTDVTSNVTAEGCGVTICGFNDTTSKTSLYQSFLTANNLRTNTTSGLDAEWKNVGVSSQMYGVLTFNSGSSIAQDAGRAIGSYSSPSTSIISSGTFTGKIVAMETTNPYTSSKYYSYDTDNHKYVLNESSIKEHNVIRIEGGSFTNTEFSEEGTSDYKGEIIITGGTFDADPTAYVDNTNYNVLHSGSTYTVTPKN